MVSPKDIEVHKGEKPHQENSHKQDPKDEQRNQLTCDGTCLRKHATWEKDNFQNQLTVAQPPIFTFSRFVVCTKHNTPP